jgi:uroporphyrin-III C-methyltransferase / precorrin-2 dehydrogenase / sirohydrochlorin ferrochelatase
MPDLLPIFLDLKGRRVLLVGAGTVAAGKLRQLTAACADVRVVAPEVCEEVERSGVALERRRFKPSDLEGVWLVVAAAPPDVNSGVAAAAEQRRIFVNAVDDPAHATAYLGGVVRRDGVTLAISTNGDAPALAGLLREALDSVLPRELGVWLEEARRQRIAWRRDGVPMSERRPILLDALNQLYGYQVPAPTSERQPRVGSEAGRRRKSVQTGGHVSLVGAGPGDPGLLTTRAVARLRAADLVLYDALVDTRVLRQARGARRFFVGKRAGRHAIGQPAIHALMIRAARRGQRVVRLKGGDPFVFGRGGEEALALRAAGISFDVVPGVTSAIAAPALAGIPVTHRGLSSALLVVSGHDESAFVSAVRDVQPNQITLVVLMGMRKRSALARRLIDVGWRAETPAAIVVDASKPAQAIWCGTVAALASVQDEVELEGPATIVIGAVAALAAAGAAVDRPQAMPVARPR